MPARPGRRSFPPSSPQFPSSPTATRTTRASSIFPYSTARPPTNYSTQSWLPQNQPPVPAASRPSQPVRADSNNPFGGLRDDDESTVADRGARRAETYIGDEGETPLYARSDWDGSEHTPIPTGQATESIYSRSSYAGMTTAPITSRGRTGTNLDKIYEDDEASLASSTSQGRLISSRDNYFSNGLVQSPGAMTASPRTASYTLGYGLTQSPGLMSAPIKTPTTPWTPSVGNHGSRRKSRSSKSRSEVQGHVRRSTLPSVLDLEHFAGGKPRRGSVNPFGDEHGVSGARQRISYRGETTPTLFNDPRGDVNGMDGASSPNLMTPAAQQRLGRMSVAPARYTLPPRGESRGSVLSANEQDDTSGLAKLGAGVETVGKKGIARTSLAYSPFITAGLSLAAALLLTISLQNDPGTLSQYILVAPGGFAVSPNGVGSVGLGPSGWCDMSGHTCHGYRGGDFANADSTYRLPGDSSLDTLGSLLMALTAFAWLLALFNLVLAFLHFYLFFALSLPLTHLVDTANTLSLSSSKGEGTIRISAAQAEVDIRVKCERPPYEDYYWLWWAWWAHTRSPLRAVYVLLTVTMALASFGITFTLKGAVAKATAEDAVKLGTGAYIPLIAFLFSLHPLVSAIKWLSTAPASWSTFLNPPDPTPAAIMLPDTEKPMKHVRNTSGDSFFAPRATMAPTQLNVDEAVPPIPGADLDPETRRWLLAYPNDPELVPLIASLRGGQENDDFILSDVGLLYLKPDTEDEPALLIPPDHGDIRKEIIQDAHLLLDEITGHPAHLDLEDISRELGQTFWWMNIEEDVKAYVDQCPGCKYDKGGVGGLAGLKPGMTPVPYTGVTGWTEEMKTRGGLDTAADGGIGQSAMAAEMAFAMRKAQEAE